jgi:hypothetical protein
MTVVLGVAATVVDVVDVIAVRNCDVAATFAMSMVMVVMSGVLMRFTLVVVAVMRLVKMPIVDVIDMVAMWDGDVAASLAMLVVMRGVFGVLGPGVRGLGVRGLGVRGHTSQGNPKQISMPPVQIS